MRAALAALCILCAGCADRVEGREVVLTDLASGCQYIGNVSGGTMQNAQLKKLYGQDGKQICVKEK